MFLVVRKRTVNENLTLQSKTNLGRAEPTTFMIRPFAVDQTDESSVPFVERVNNINIVDLSDTSMEFSSFAQNFLPFTEMS